MTAPNPRFGLGATLEFLTSGVEIQITKIGAVADENISVAMLAVSAAGFTFRKLTAGGAANLVTWRVLLRIPRGIVA